MKKIFTLLRKSNISRFISVLPLVILLPISIPAWSSEKWPLEAWPESTTISVECTKWPASEDAWPTSGFDTFAFPENAEWQYMGKVRAVTDLRIINNGKDYKETYEYVFVYSSFNGEKMKYRIYVPSIEQSFDVVTSTSYCNASFGMSPSGKYYWSIPPLSHMFTHYAGPYHFNMSSVSNH